MIIQSKLTPTQGYFNQQYSQKWNISDDDLKIIPYFSNMMEFSDNSNINTFENPLLIDSVTDQEIVLVIEYIRLYKIENNPIELKDKIRNMLRHLSHNKLFWFTRISDFFLIDDALELCQEEIQRRLHFNLIQ
jgi:hypothetical protein